ncbi:MAG: sigma-70 family RNA polymerase sigma factor [Akkermansiaceae bacterium]|nr:sigma-70 family RNA polymerase sigma factor [Armatimonadota bacterium]
MSFAFSMPGPNAALAATPNQGAPSDSERGAQPFATPGETDGDVFLVRRAAEGDRTAFRELFERYQRPIAALVGRMVASPDDVDDILQETFLRAWKGLPRFRGDAQFSTWLYRIAVNTAIKYRSRRKNETASLVSLSPDEETGMGGIESLPADPGCDPLRGGDPFQAAQKQEQEQVIRKAVQALPEKQRSVVLLHYFEGRSCEEISGIVGCSLGTVWSRLHYACKRLKGVLTGAPHTQDLFAASGGFDGEAHQ